ncbi:MAG: cytochrome C [Geobacteraceae bacterium]|nr:cytochrome C [Geobacteraceae bacterium]NTW79657.1 cytochrome C [Geobacteraceae bacterium]
MKTWVISFAIVFLLGTYTSLYAETCSTITCHTAITAFKNSHQPLKDGNCFSCHQQTVKEHPLKGGKSFGFTAKPADLCKTCHNKFVKKKQEHPPFKDGDCIACHNPHGASGRFLLDDSEDRSGLCFGCHDSAPFSQKFVHGPVATGSCNVCHDPHQSDVKSLLKGASRELCLSCHSDFAAKMQAASIIHPPVKKEPCTSCHNPHSSLWPNMLKKGMPDLCTECHKETAKKIKNAKVPHKPVNEGRLCASCHSAHFSKAKGLMSTDDEKSTCLSCHNNDKLGNPPLANVKKDLEGKKHVHGPIKKGLCSGCHAPHGSNFPRILTGNYPSEFYVPFKEGSYSFCLKCHDKNIVNFAETTIYTKFRNGSRNLHFVHVNNSKGRNCKACHETHASNGTKLISAEGTKFGEWRVQSRLQLTSTGGSCAPGCHRRYSYDRAKPVDMAFPLNK